MTDPTHTDAAGTTPQVDLPITFRAFQELHADAYYDYAYACLDDATLAQDLVTDAFTELGACWDRVLTHPQPATHAWAALRHLVEVEREHVDRYRALSGRLMFSAALRLEKEPFLDDLTASVNNLEAGIALGEAIKNLTGAKFDVIVLRFITGLTVARTAQAMGIDQGTVKSLTTQARHKLEARLQSRRIISPGTTKDQE
ncbi:sigma factor-like helix-turn-helix DNA-binding protein [Kitasatospora sp. NPDC050463]|uniref:RNA polymerase sigma factor n=1 Tax=Kitasatospora sp. NPDC050463 TaxID=3155786 RepID=UPI003405DD60